MPKVSVIVNCYNGSEYLREALDSVYSQTFPDWEIVFWDNASTDDSPLIAASYDSKIRYFRNESSVPLGSARNSALAEARGAYIAFLDTDDYWLPTKLEKQLSLFESRPHLGLVHSDVICLFQSNGSQIRHFKRLGHMPPRGMVFGYLLRHSAIAMPSVLILTDALRSQNELFDTRFEIYPDFDLFRRIAHDWECDYIDEPLAVYRIHAKSSSSRNHLRSADELRLSIEKFRHIYPDIDEKYTCEMSYLDSMIAYQRGKSLWREGNGRAARIEFSRKLRTPKLAAAYFASCIPYSFIERIWSKLTLIRNLL